MAYDGNGNLDKITDPVGRVLDVTVSGGWLKHLTDPDTLTTYLEYRSEGFISAQLPRHRDSTATGWTAYSYALGFRLTKVDVSLDSASTQLATTEFQSWDEKDVVSNGSTGNTALLPDAIYTKILGPRTGIADDATFWIDRWGAPTKSIGAIHDTTQYFRLNDTVPALVTRIVYPNGAVNSLSWDARGNLTQARDSTATLTYGLPTSVRKWTYSSAVTKDSPDTLVGAEGDITTYTYNSWGLTSTVKAPNGHVTQFDYVTAGALSGLLRMVTELHVPVWDSASKSETIATIHAGFALNSLGNVVADTSPMGRVRLYTRDSLQHLVVIHDPAGHRTDRGYDLLNRLTRLVEYPDSGGYNSTLFPADSGFSASLTTTQHYVGDVLDSVLDPRQVPRTYGYDAANRPVAETDEAGNTEHRFFNTAGLIDSIHVRAPSTTTIKMTYDAAGRLTGKKWPTTWGIAGDSVRYVYDVMGRVDTMKSVSAGLVIAHTYYANGLLRTDVQPYATHFYGYDRAGKRTFDRIGVPDSTKSDSVWYHYDAHGDLTAIGVRWRAQPGHNAVRDSVRFRWDSLGRRDSIAFTNGAHVSYAYDADGMLRLVCSYHRGGTTAFGHPDHLDLTMLNEWVDADGMIRQQTWNPAVAGCGQNNDQPISQANIYGVRHQLLRQTQGSHWNAYAYDGSGNIVKANDNSYARSDTMRTSHSNQLWKQVTSGYPDYAKYQYNPDGSRNLEVNCTSSTGVCADTTREYLYDGLGRMAGTAAYACTGVDPVLGCTSTGTSVNVACTYGPDGRLINSCDNLTGSPLGYDGDNVVRTGPDSTRNAWTFVHGPGLDDPLMGYFASAPMRIYFLGDGSGRQFAVADTAGEDVSATNEYFYDGGLAAGGTTNSASFGATRQPSGSLTGLNFFRNRVYDQATGRWTQEDPIGVSGGVNIYQFNGNNPAAFTDPFGLDTVEVGCRPLKGPAGVVANHCAVRVGANGKKQAGELLYNGKNKIEVFDGTGARASEYDWVVVPVPDGQTENGFDAATVNSFNAQSKAKNGKPYSAHSKKNSNRFVFDVITGAGGTMPQGAVPASGITPGLCGGGGRFATGDQCSQSQ